MVRVAVGLELAEAEATSTTATLRLAVAELLAVAEPVRTGFTVMAALD
jgi:hypothetical protein